MIVIVAHIAIETLCISMGELTINIVDVQHVFILEEMFGLLVVELYSHSDS